MKYRTIVADPPWRYDRFMPSYTPATGKVASLPNPYGMMDVAEIRALRVGSLAASDSRLFLWTTNRYLPNAFDILAAWGFDYRQILTWHKTGRVPPYGGSVAPNHSEFLLVGVQGAPPRLERWPSSVIAAPRGDHSAKPECFLDFIESSSLGPYLELFARRARFGWDYAGNESLSTVEIPGLAA